MRHGDILHIIVLYFWIDKSKLYINKFNLKFYFINWNYVFYYVVKIVNWTNDKLL